MTDTAELFIDCRCALGEGPIWHPLRNELFWFDINAHALFNASSDGAIINRWLFDESVAAAAIIDRDDLLIAAASKLIRFNILHNDQQVICPLEADNPLTRTNDSRVNLAGGFWIGTMGMNDDAGLGAVYQYRAGKIEKLFGDVGIPNSTCFSPDGTLAYWTDTLTGKILKCEIDPQTGLPIGEWQLHIDTEGQRGAPDGAIIDSEGYMWSARWGGSCVIRHAPDGSIDRIVEVPASNVTCPALGGTDLKTLYVTTASKGLTPEEQAAEPQAGSVFAIRVDVPGQPEPFVML